MKKYLFFGLLCFSLTFFSCKKNELGGKASIKGTVRHHAKLIANATIFVKYNAKEFPGTDTSLYDAKVKADANGNYVINCYKGNYYLFGYGYDYALPPPYICKGGIGVNIRNNENLEFEIAITE